MTFSINTNNAAMAALESLSATQSALNSTENTVSTGLKVSDASDNPAIYSISSQMNANIAGLSAVSDSLSFGSSVLTVASSATTSIISTLTSLQNSVTEAGTTGISTTSMQTAIAQALNQINDYARSSTFNGVNLLTTQSDTSGTSTSNNLNVIDSVNGGSIAVANQTTAMLSGANTLTSALGLTSATMAAGDSVIASGTAGTGEVTQTLLGTSAGGVNISFGSSLAASSFSSGTTVSLTNGDGTTTTFEFVAAGSAAATPDSSTNHTVTIVMGSGETSNQLVGDLVTSMNANGYDANLQSDGSVDVTGNGVDASTSNVSGINAGTTLTTSAALVNTIQSAITKMTSIASNLGYATQQVTGMQTFTSSLSDAMTSGVGALVDADLSEESAKLTSLQTKQSLAIQSLSIANSQSQSILSLFR